MDEKKKELINKVTGILIDEMTKKTISHKQAQEIATYILDKSKGIKNENGISDFLKLLAEKYSIFKLYYVNKSLEKQIELTDKEKMDSIKEQLSKLASFKTK